MNFTREPIIETIITPKDGYKLMVRNSKGREQEEYTVDAIEVVSFGHSFFFRSMERPKSFLVPVSDYEVVEIKETRVVLKNANIERSIKIGGGREAPKTYREVSEKIAEVPAAEESDLEERSVESIVEQRIDKKRDRRRHRRRRGGVEDRQESREWPQKQRTDEKDTQTTTERKEHEAREADRGGGAHDETQVSSPSFSTLLPPPSTLISQTIGRYKDQAFLEGNISSRSLEEESKTEGFKEGHLSHQELSADADREKKEDKKKKHDDDDSSESGGMHLSRSRSLDTEGAAIHSFLSLNSGQEQTSVFGDYYFLT